MKLTNKLNLPAPLVAAITAVGSKYSKGDAKYSITGLIKPARISQLERLHWNELEKDISEDFWRASGTAFHLLMKHSGEVGEREVPYFGEIKGIKVKGEVDFFEPVTAVVTDYKETSVWKLVYAKDGVPEDWIEQLNGYAMLMRMNGREVKALQVMVKLRDWMSSKAVMDPSYPQAAGVLISIPLWTHDECLNFFEERIQAHERALVELPLCTAAERKEEPTIYAVKKSGQKNAVKGGLYESIELAASRIAEDSKHFLEVRPGKSARCEKFCHVSAVCEQYAEIRAEAQKPLSDRELAEMAPSELAAVFQIKEVKGTEE